MNIVITIVIGFIVGVIAKFLMPGKDGGGFIVTTALGVLGSTVGAFLGEWFGFYKTGEPAGFIASIIGAMIVLFAVRLLRKG